MTITLFVLFSPTSGYLWPPQTLQNKGKRKMTNRPFFTLPQPRGLALGLAVPFCNSKFHFARLTLSHPPNTSVFLPRPLHPCAPSSSPVPRPFLARPRPALARPSPGPRPALAWPRPPLAHPGLKQSCRQNGQKRNLLFCQGWKSHFEVTFRSSPALGAVAQQRFTILDTSW